MISFLDTFRRSILNNFKVHPIIGLVNVVPVRFKKDKCKLKEIPKNESNKNYRFLVEFPEEYTVKPLNVRHLAGRDPVTGRIIHKGLGGGIKHKYHWIKWMRYGPSEGPPQEEKVIRIIKCGHRSSFVALVAFKDEMKYILATENMKPGDIIKTSMFLPRNFVSANEGDAYPLGALPLGTFVHNIQVHIDREYTIVHSAGSKAIITKHLNEKVVVQLPSKVEMAFNCKCMATVGRLSNVEHASIPIGSPQKLREMGFRPRSGLWHRKTGKHGRKIKSIPPVQYPKSFKPPVEYIRCTSSKFNI